MPTRYTEIVAGGRSYRLDRAAMALFNEKAKLHHITSQNMRLLELFISYPKHALVTRGQVFQHLYADKAVNNEAVDLAIKSLRKALGPGFIVTDHRKGYRLAADIRHFEEVVEEDNPPLPTPPLDGEGVTLRFWVRERRQASYVLKWDEIIIAIGPSMLQPINEFDIEDKISECIASKEKSNPIYSDFTPSYVRYFEGTQRLLTSLFSAGLAEPYHMEMQFYDAHDRTVMPKRYHFWQLTRDGQQYLKTLLDRRFRGTA